MNPINHTRKFSEACEALGVRKLASESEIRTAWRRLAFETHPDRPNGSAEKFKRVNDAYELLRGQGHGQRWSPLGEPAFAQQASDKKWNRPRVKTNKLRVNTAITSMCRMSLGEDIDPHKADDHAVAAQHHIPHEIRRKGREVSYYIKTALKKGHNQVALPTGELSGKREPAMQVVSLNARSDGQATIEVPNEMRSAKFPGARRVRLHFAKSEDRETANP